MEQGKDRVKRVRRELKNLYPNFKFSVTTRRMSSILVDILSGDVDCDLYHAYQFKSHQQQDEARESERYLKALEILKNVERICSVGKVDYNSGDPFADYCNCNFYVHVNMCDYKYNKCGNS